ncbi:ABC transporter ATP-binding protein [Lipingzhangella sp. LS1_29]|uniref:ABC transporter ATP-binding protein n=1 Tax=Lipingzhangella rawalii TaxID=2055835 RepID=A0ABU2HAC9_9ACTN|nr:ABC transporter ATP-binding protein [Lipingzhangella rawalii]MDS1272279.1 ABC transporter ATP-binding protein [Lipingzhangella rawalii]
MGYSQHCFGRVFFVKMISMGDVIGENVIDVTRVWRRYGSGRFAFDAVRGISFSVARGELFGLLGTNGAGKTSTIELMVGLGQPSSGSIRVFGQCPVRDRRTIRPRQGVMLQRSGLAQDLTVAETLHMWAGCTSHPRSVDAALTSVGLHDRKRVAVKNLSGGEQRRLDLAMATIAEPELLFLDEPTTGMDPEGRHATWQIIRKLKETGTTIVLTTHYLEEAEMLADRLAIMHAGQIAAAGTLPEIIDQHPSRISFEFPAGFVASDFPPAEQFGADWVHERGRRIEFSTTNLQFTATELLTWARSRNMTLTGLDARSASLEEAFLHIAENSADGAVSESLEQEVSA